MSLTSSLPAEVALIESLAGGFRRSPRQVNRRHESDAELLRLPGGGLLALTTDAIVEEIERGLYRDPWQIGWMIVTVNASDLAAVGAEPLGFLVSETLPPGLPVAQRTALQEGIAAACEAYRLPVLGGDTNSGERLQLCGTAVGLVPGAPLSRRGLRPGDRLVASGPLGLGGAYGFSRFLKEGSVSYHPRARLSEGAVLRRFASAAMDTSDGVIPALDELGRLNGVGFAFDVSVDALLHPDARASAEQAGVPPWVMLAGPHGEFELLAGVPPDQMDLFRAAAASIGWEPWELGEVVPEPGLQLAPQGLGPRIDLRRARDLYHEQEDVRQYLAGLLALTAA